jgi:hypothetical protein
MLTTRLRRVLDKTTSGKKKDWQQCHSINKKKERITIMKTMFKNIKKALKAILANYMTAMEMYGEALNRSRGCACA